MIRRSLKAFSKLASSSIFRQKWKKIPCYFFSSLKDDYYQILKVPKNASIEEIKKSYYSLAKQYHPDINKNNYE